MNVDSAESARKYIAAWDDFWRRGLRLSFLRFALESAHANYTMVSRTDPNGDMAKNYEECIEVLENYLHDAAR